MSVLQPQRGRLPFLSKEYTNRAKWRSGQASKSAAVKHERPGGKERSVRVGVLMNIPALLQAHGVDPRPVFDRSGLEITHFADPDHRLSYLKLSYLLAECVEATHCDHFGLLLGQSAEPSHLGIAGYVVRVCADVETALAKLTDYFDLHDEGGEISLSVGPELTLLGYTVIQPGAKAVDQIHDLTIAFAFGLMRTLCGPAWRPSRVLLSRHRPASTAPYRALFGSMPQFNADKSAVAFSSEWLQQPVSSADKLMLRHFELEVAESRRLQHLQLVEALSRQLQLDLLEGVCSAQATARNMGLNKHTLRRRLKAEGTGFRLELDKVRQTLSRQLLEGTNISVAEIAGLMGYSSSSSFIRAFSRWTGRTPNEWRHSRR